MIVFGWLMMMSLPMLAVCPADSTGCKAGMLELTAPTTDNHAAAKADSCIAADPDAFPADKMDDNKQSRYEYLFYSAMAKLNSGNDTTALRMLQQCREMKPDAAEVYFFMASCYQHQGQDSLKVEMLTRAAELQPDNVTYKEELIPIYLEKEDLDNAAAIMEDIVRDTPERTDMLQVLLQIYNYKNDNDRTLNTLNRLITQEGQTEQLAMTKVQLYNKMGNDKEAEAELRSLCTNHPLDLNYRVMMGNWLLSKDRKPEALAEYTAVLAEEPENENALMSMMDYYRAEGRDSIADAQRENLLLSPKTQQTTRMLLLKQYLRQQEQAGTDSTVVLRLFDRMLQQKQPDTEVIEYKLAYMTLKNMPKDSIALVLHQILDERPEHAQARFQLIQMAWEQGDAKEMIRLAKPAQQYNPEEWAFSYFLGVGYYLNDEKQLCIEALTTAAEHVDETNQKTLAEEMYALLGDALHSVGNSKKAYEAYENCLRLNPDNNSALNNYAYYLSTEHGDLDKAATMSLKTIKAEPNNATFLDTYAWIMYLQGRYEEAKIYIDMAVKNIPEDEDHTEIVNHQKQIESKLK